VLFVGNVQQFLKIVPLVM